MRSYHWKEGTKNMTISKRYADEKLGMDGIRIIVEKTPAPWGNRSLVGKENLTARMGIYLICGRKTIRNYIRDYVGRE